MDKPFTCYYGCTYASLYTGIMPSSTSCSVYKEFQMKPCRSGGLFRGAEMCSDKYFKNLGVLSDKKCAVLPAELTHPLFGCPTYPLHPFSFQSQSGQIQTPYC